MVKMKQYLAYFQNIHYEKLITDVKDNVTDSLQHVVPFATITVTDVQGKKHAYNFMHKQPVAGKNAQYGVDYKYDPDRLFMRFADEKETALVQYFVFGKLLQTYGYFLPPPVKK
jgi:predicted Zn-dependent protease